MRTLIASMLFALVPACLAAAAPDKPPTEAEAKETVAKDIEEIRRLNLRGQTSREYFAGIAQDHLSFWRKAEEMGLPEGMYLVGRCYERGNGVAVDYAEAMKHFRMGAEKGCAPAEAEIGWLCMDGLGVKKDAAEALTWWRKAADHGDMISIYNVGRCYETGRGVARDVEAALGWYRKSAEAGNAAAMVNLGLIYRRGVLVARNGAEAYAWFKKALDAGDDDALVEIGRCYLNGWGVKKDEAEAMKWIVKSAERGCPEGLFTLGACYEYGQGVARDRTKAAQWYRLAAEKGNASAQTNLGLAYQFGRGVPQDVVEAMRWYRLAADQGQAIAQYNLAYSCQHGVGNVQDAVEAVKWYRLAAEQGHVSAQYSLAWCLQNGNGAPKNDIEAVKWYRKAADEGNRDARRRLALIYEYGLGVKENLEDAAFLRGLATEPGAPFMKNDLFEQESAFLKRVVVDAYRKKPGKDPKWDSSGQAVVDRAAFGPKSQEDEVLAAWRGQTRDVVALGRVAVNAGCDDPMVLFWFAEALEREGRNGESFPYRLQALKGFEAGQYTVDFTYRAAKSLVGSVLLDRAGKDRIEKLATESLIATICRGPYGPDEQRLLFRHFLERLDEDHLGFMETICEATRDAPGASPWTVHTLTGRMYVSRAWNARGSGWAREVNKEQWAAFEENLRKAREHLEKAWDLDKKVPDAAASMITVAMGESLRNEEALWLRRATEVQVDYEPAYEQWRWALRPRWGGSHAKMIEFGLSCVKGGRFDTDVPFDLFRVAQEIAEDEDGDWVKVLSMPGLYDGLQGMFDKYMEANPKKAVWALSFKAALAWRMSRWAEAKKYVDQAGKDLVRPTFWIVGGPLEANKEIDRRVAAGGK